MTAPIVISADGAALTSTFDDTSLSDARTLALRARPRGPAKVYLHPKAQTETARPEGKMSIEGRGWHHAEKVNGRLVRDEPLFVATGLVPLLTPQEGVARIVKGEAAVEQAKTLAASRNERQHALWTETCAALGAAMVEAPHRTLDRLEYRINALHNAARDRVPWVFQGPPTLRCERCGTTEHHEAGDYEVACVHEAAFLRAHAGCLVATLAPATEDDADVVIDHHPKVGTVVYPLGGHWPALILRVLGVRFDSYRSYSEPFFVVSHTKGLAAPDLDLEALAASLRDGGARVFIAWGTHG